MYKRFIAIVLSLSFVLILTAGCANNEEEANTLESKQTIEDVLTETGWKANILGFEAKVTFGADGKGHAEAAGISKDFNYTVSNTTTNPIAGDITVTGTGISEIDGKTAHVEYKDGEITASYDNISYTFKPDSDNA